MMPASDSRKLRAKRESLGTYINNIDEFNNDDPLPYKCKLCKKGFKHSSALGGHISKAHPGQSDSYNHKKRVRETRELERELHRRTLRLFSQCQAAVAELQASGTADPEQLSIMQSSLSRNTIKRIKKMLVLQDEHYENLRSKFLVQAPQLYISSDFNPDSSKSQEDMYLLSVIQNDIDDPNRDDRSNPIDTAAVVANHQ